MSIKSIFNNIYLKNIVAIIIVIALLIVATFWALNIYTKHGEAVVVPDIKGVTVAEALPLLKSKGLRYEVVDSIFAKNKTPGVICEQVPQANTKVKPNRIIFITINSFSTKQIELPDVRDLSLRQAETILQNAGFATSILLVDSEFKDLVLRVKKGEAIVYPGTKLLDGTRLTLEVGNGGDSAYSDSIRIDSAKEGTTTSTTNDDSWF